MPLLMRILRAVVARSGGAAAGLLLTYVVVRTLSLEQAGYFLLAYTVLAFLRPISVFGTNTVSLKHIGAAFELGQWGELQGHSIKTLAIVTLMTALLSVVVWLSAPILALKFWGMPDMVDVMRTGAYAVLPLGLTLLLSSFFQAIQRTVAAVLILTVNISASLAVLLLIVAFERASSVATALVGVAWINALVAAGWWFVRMGGYKPIWPSFGQVMGPSFAIWIATIMTTTTKWNGQIIAAAWVEPDEIAYLVVAQRLALAVSFIMIAINLVTAPLFAGLHQKSDIYAMQRLASTTTYAMVAVGSVVFVVFVLFSRTAMGLFGEEFRDYGYLLIILATGQLINAVTGSSGYILIMAGFERQYRNLIAVSTAASLLFSFLLIPIFGLTGAAIATALGVSGQHLGAAFLVRKYLGINIYQHV